MNYLDQGTASGTVFMWLRNRITKMLHSDPRTMQGARVINMFVEEVCQHGQTIPKRQG